MHPCPRNRVAIGFAVVYYARTAHASSAGIKCRHCIRYYLVWLNGVMVNFENMAIGIYYLELASFVLRNPL